MVSVRELQDCFCIAYEQSERCLSLTLLFIPILLAETCNNEPRRILPTLSARFPSILLGTIMIMARMMRTVANWEKKTSWLPGATFGPIHIREPPRHPAITMRILGAMWIILSWTVDTIETLPTGPCLGIRKWSGCRNG